MRKYKEKMHSVTIFLILFWAARLPAVAVGLYALRRFARVRSNPCRDRNTGPCHKIRTHAVCPYKIRTHAVRHYFISFL